MYDLLQTIPLLYKDVINIRGRQRSIFSRSPGLSSLRTTSITEIQLTASQSDSTCCFQTSLKVATESWGVTVERVEVKDVRVPENLQRAMAAEAEAAREARAKVIAAEGEHKASRALKHAAEVITEDPAALQVRTENYLQRIFN